MRKINLGLFTSFYKILNIEFVCSANFGSFASCLCARFVCLQMCQNVWWVVDVQPCPTNIEVSAGRVAANGFALPMLGDLKNVCPEQKLN